MEQEIKAELDKIADKVREHGEKYVAEAKTASGVSKEAKEKADEMLVKFGEVQAQLTDIQQKQARAGTSAAEQAEAQKSIGERVTDTDGFKDFAKKMSSGERPGSFSFKVGSFHSQKAITSLTGSAGTAVAPDFRGDIISMGRRQFTIRDLMLPGRTSSNAITYVKETGFTNSAAPVSETVRKPESSLVLTAVIQPVITLAHYMKAAKQILDDVPQLQSYINGRLSYGLRYVEETQLLKGSGTGLNLNGIYTQAATYTAPTGYAPTAATIIDKIRGMMLQTFLAEFPATGIVLNPIDWASIETTKDAQARYIIGNPNDMLGARLWGLPVVETQAMTQNTGLVGAFRPFSQIFDREDANVVIATENEDDFVKNMITIRNEERLASAVFRPEAFVKNTSLSS